MEISSVSTLSNSEFANGLGSGSDISSDAFSNLLSMILGNMFIQNFNSNSITVNQSNIPDTYASSGDENKINNIFSILDNLNVNGFQYRDADNIQNLISSMEPNINSELQNMLGTSNNISLELKEFMDYINNFNSNESEMTLNIPVDNIIEKLDENIITPESNKTTDVTKINAEFVKSIEYLDTTSDDYLKINNIDIEKSDNLSPTTVNISNDVIETTSTDDIKNNNSNIEKNEIEIDTVRPKEKTNTSFEPVNILDSSLAINNTKNENTGEVALNSNIKEAVVIERPQDIIDITVEKFKTLRLPGSTEVTVKLKPEELGEISLKLVLEKGQINGNITADKKEVVSMLQSNIEMLKTELKNSNINLNNLSVNVQTGEDFSRNSGQRGFGNRQNRNSNSFIRTFEEEVNSPDLSEGINIIA